MCYLRLQVFVLLWFFFFYNLKSLIDYFHLSFFPFSYLHHHSFIIHSLKTAINEQLLYTPFVVLSHWDFRVNLLHQQSPAWLGYYFKPCALLLQSKHCLQAQGWQAMFSFGFSFCSKALLGGSCWASQEFLPELCLAWIWLFGRFRVLPGECHEALLILRGQCGGQCERVLAFTGAGKREKGVKCECFPATFIQKWTKKNSS